MGTRRVPPPRDGASGAVVVDRAWLVDVVLKLDATLSLIAHGEIVDSTWSITRADLRWHYIGVLELTCADLERALGVAPGTIRTAAP